MRQSEDQYSRVKKVGGIVGWGDESPLTEKDMMLKRGKFFFLDHPYRLKDDFGEFVWVSEPYSISVEAMEELVVLGRRGWDVKIQPRFTMYYPGKTVAIWIRKNSVNQRTMDMFIDKFLSLPPFEDDHEKD